jgi:hypothetical protein
MRKIDLNRFYLIGKRIQFFEVLREGESPLIAHSRLGGLQSWIHIFLEETLGVPLAGARQAAVRLSEHLAHLTAEQMEKMEAKIDTPITLHESVMLERFVKDFETEFEHDCRELNVFAVSNIGTHSTTKLLEKAHINLPKETVARLPEDVLSEVDAAGRCLAFHQGTASAFHILRAVEKLIVTYRQKILGRPVNLRSRNWGAYIREFRANGADSKVVDYLHHLKEYYRNPIMHPEVVLSVDDAFSLFNACLSALVQLDAAILAWP